jgi:predicted Zn finger-like uncharacterized protein
MKTRCPHCATLYDVDPKLAEGEDRLARCFNCGEVFDIAEYRADDTAAEVAEGLRPAHGHTQTIDADARDSSLPFDVPRDLPAIEPSGSIPLTAKDTLHPAQTTPTPWWQKLLLALLLVTLLLQLAWLRRDLWVYLPLTSQVCAWLNCNPPRQDHPELYRVVDRDMRALPGPPPALRLNLSFSNEARFSQALPRLQLSLLDSNGSLVARRLLQPAQYLPASWSGPPVALPKEVVTIQLEFEDPGPRVRSFAFDFL